MQINETVVEIIEQYVMDRGRIKSQQFEKQSCCSSRTIHEPQEFLRIYTILLLIIQSNKRNYFGDLPHICGVGLVLSDFMKPLLHSLFKVGLLRLCCALAVCIRVTKVEWGVNVATPSEPTVIVTALNQRLCKRSESVRRNTRTGL